MSDTGRVLDDNSSKVVLWCKKAVVGYSGLARIDGMPTSQWIATTIAPGRGPAQRLRDEATAAFLKPWATRIWRKDRRTAFLAVSWGSDGTPLLSRISNFYTATGGWLAEAVAGFDTLNTTIPKGKRYYFETAGLDLDPASIVRINYALRHHCRMESGAQEVLRMLVREIRLAASEKNGIGQNLLSVVIPKKEALSSEGHIFVAFGPHTSSGMITSQFWANGSETPIQFGPDFACNGSVWVNAHGGTLSVGSVRIRPNQQGVDVEYPLYFPAEPRASGGAGVVPVVVNDGSTNLFIVAASPEGLPKIGGPAPIQHGCIEDRERFIDVLKLVLRLAEPAQTIAFVQGTSGLNTRTSVQYYLSTLE